MKSHGSFILIGLIGLLAPILAYAEDACTVQSLTKNASEGMRVESPDGTRYLINKEDANGTAQMYVGAMGNAAAPTCITCVQKPGGPKPERFKMQPRWHPSGRWIFMAVERDSSTYTSPFPDRNYIEGQLQNGIWTNLHAVSPDGETWHRLTDFKSGVTGAADGYTGPAITPDGKTLVWAQIMDGNIFVYYPFGRWELTQADFVETNGVPSLANARNVTPTGMNWNEVSTFRPDGETLLITGSTASDAQGMDQYFLNIRTGQLTNLTNSPSVWDEHGVLSPDGEKIIWMSAYPYRDDPDASKILSIKTEFMLMNKDGSDYRQLTHFKTPGYPEFGDGIAANPSWSLDGRSASLRRLSFPNYEDWTVTFKGPCGRTPPAPPEPQPNPDPGETATDTPTQESGTPVRVHPSPWRATRHTGTNLIFDGLSAGDTVKIFTVSGKSIASLSATGASAEWNLKNADGQAVASGLYLYVVTNPQGRKTRGKFAIIK